MKFVTLFFFMFLLCACKSGAQSNAPEKEIKEPNCKWWYSDSCSCDDGEYLVDVKGRKQCVSLEKTHFCMETENGFQIALAQKDMELFDRCLEISTQQTTVFSKTPPTVSIAADMMTLAEKRRFAEWADKNTQVLKNLKTWVKPNGWRSDVLIANDQRVAQAITDIFNPMMLTPNMGIDYMGVAFAPMYFSSVEAMTEYLAKPQEKTQINKNQFGTVGITQELLDIYEGDWKTDVRMDKTNSKSGCQFACSQSAEWSHGSYGVEYRQYLVEGNVYRAELLVRDAQRQTVGYVYLAGKRFLQMGVFARDSMGMVTRSTVYNDQGRILFTSTSHPRAEKLLSEREYWVKKNTHFDFSVAVCEWDFWPEEYAKNGLADHLHFGPHVESSYFGWTEYDGDWQTFWRERIFYNAAGLPYAMKGQGGSEHNLRVSELIVSGALEHIGIVPIDGRDCLNGNIDKAFSNVKEHGGVRVVNLSITDFQDREVCERHFEGHPLNIDTDMLWVIAAGNDGTQGSNACPQHFSGRKNVLVVGASRNGFMDHQSNYGANYVDIAALGTQLNSSMWGTSFAAPRVSQVAARIFHNYPEMSAAQVRLSILLGADIASSYFAARSRGELNEKRALMYAELLHGGSSVEDAVQTLECFSPYYQCQDGQKKLKAYESFR